MDIRFLRYFGSNQPGQEVQNFHAGAAAELVRRGVAEVIESPAPKTNAGNWRQDDGHNGKRPRKK
jgi:hypothetical protein